MDERQTALADFLSRQEWDVFFTSTFKVHQRYSATAIERVWRTISASDLTRPAKAFIAAEQHKLGGWHCHGLLQWPAYGVAGYDIQPLFLGATGLRLGRLGYQCSGSVDSEGACATYLSKYILKDEFHGDYNLFGRKKFWKGS